MLQNLVSSLAETNRHLSHRLTGGGGATISESGTLTGKFHTLYVGAETSISEVVGGTAGSQTWVTTIPAGVTLTAPTDSPITSFTIEAQTTGFVVAYS